MILHGLPIKCHNLMSDDDSLFTLRQAIAGLVVGEKVDIELDN